MQNMLGLSINLLLALSVVFPIGLFSSVLSPVEVCGPKPKEQTHPSMESVSYKV